MKEASHLARYEVGHFPTMALYHNTENLFDLLVADSSRLVTEGLLGRAKEEVGWQTVPSRRTTSKKSDGLQDIRVVDKGFYCEECGVELESKGLLDAHIFNHGKSNSHSQFVNEAIKSKTGFICDDCDEEYPSEDDLKSHIKEDHDDGAWCCNDCHFQTNTSEQLRQHLKKKGHQPSESAIRQSNEIRKCYTCRKEFEGYTAMMNHRYKNHPSNKVCKNIPICTGWVNGNR